MAPRQTFSENIKLSWCDLVSQDLHWCEENDMVKNSKAITSLYGYLSTWQTKKHKITTVNTAWLQHYSYPRTWQAEKHDITTMNTTVAARAAASAAAEAVT